MIEARAEGIPLMPRNVALPPTTEPALGSGWITYAYWNSPGCGPDLGSSVGRTRLAPGAHYEL